MRSYLVSRRTREFGVRLAVGASPAHVLRLVVRESLATTTVGLSIGLGLAILLGWGLRAAIYQISPLDPVTLGAASAILAIVARGVNHSGSTGCERSPDDRAQKQLTPQV